MPHSHNLIEGMSQGAIPILPYGELMCPPLESEVNCLSFATLDELDDAVDAALSMSPTRVAEMRASVLRYYREVLSPAAVGAQIFERRPSTLYVNAEHTSVASFVSHSTASPDGE